MSAPTAAICSCGSTMALTTHGASVCQHCDQGACFTRFCSLCRALTQADKHNPKR